jgi:hypothetical protein
MLDCRLTLRQLDVIWDDLGLGIHPYPLTIPYHGATRSARQRLRDDVRAELRRTGHVDRRNRLEPDLEAALRMLARPERSVDSVWLDAAAPDRARRTLAVRTGRRAVLAIQRPHPTGSLEDANPNGITIRDIHIKALAEHTIATMPTALGRTEITDPPTGIGAPTSTTWTAVGVLGVHTPDHTGDDSPRQEVRWILRAGTCEAIGPPNQRGRLLIHLNSLIAYPSEHA